MRLGLEWFIHLWAQVLSKGDELPTHTPYRVQYFVIFLRLFTHTNGSRCVGRVFSSVCAFVCMSLCSHSRRKTARASNTKLGRHTAHDSRSVCIDPEVKRSEVKVTRQGMFVDLTA